MITFSNPRTVAEFPDWPMGGNKRGPCKFWVEWHAKRGWRVGRQTTGKPKFHTYSGQAAIVDGSDGRTYILQVAAGYGFIKVSRSDFMDASGWRSSDPTKQDSAVFNENDPELYAELLKLIVAAGSFAKACS